MAVSFITQQTTVPRVADVIRRKREMPQKRPIRYVLRLKGKLNTLKVYRRSISLQMEVDPRNTASRSMIMEIRESESEVVISVT